ncbi:uncharacterized protein LOC129743539 [Uranotaenia lowii]|uniref:uncharacterized protein LOC129743539 n=1 Tax=Uranotaenia lowii TaxID=190385 RepID=UPI00247A6A98|nr:uncharacterized protein LOC129743539 [Uranotaenia lowii]
MSNPKFEGCIAVGGAGGQPAVGGQPTFRGQQLPQAEAGLTLPHTAAGFSKELLFDGRTEIFGAWKMRLERRLARLKLSHTLIRIPTEEVDSLSLEDPVEETARAERFQRRMEQEEAAMDELVMAINNDVPNKIVGVNFIKDAMDILCDSYLVKGTSAIIAMRGRLNNLPMTRFDSLSSLFYEYDLIIREMDRMGANLSRGEKVHSLLLAIPPAYSHIQGALAVLPPEELSSRSIVDIKRLFLDSELLQNTSASTIQPRGEPAVANHALRTASKKGDSRCFGCGEKGHFKSRCPKLKAAKKNGSRRDKVSAHAMLARVKRKLAEEASVRAASTIGPISAAAERGSAAKSVRRVVAIPGETFDAGRKQLGVTVAGVAAPHSNGIQKASPTSKVVPPQAGGILKSASPQVSGTQKKAIGQAKVATKATTKSERRVRFVVDSGATHHMVCDERLVENISKLATPIELSTAKTGESMKAYKKGTVSLKAMVNDDYSHFTVIYLLKRKSEVFEKFKEFEAMATAHFNQKLAKLRCDNGQWRERKNQQNVDGKSTSNALRMRSSEIVMGRSCVLRSLSHKSIAHTSPCGDKTPFEMWYGKKPDLSNLRIFGCNAYALVPKEKRQKLDPKTKKLIFAGYANNGYRLYNKSSRTVEIHRSVVFDEQELLDRRNDLLHSTISQPASQNAPVIESEPPAKSSEASENFVGNEDEHLVEHHVGNVDESDYDSAQDLDSHTDGEGEVGSQPVSACSSPIRRSTRDRRAPEFYTAKIATDNSDIPQTVDLLKTRDDWPKWKIAISEELKALNENKTWKKVESLPKERKSISSKWVFAIKEDGRYKARLVAKGCSQRPGYDYDETFAPVVKMESVRTILSLANQSGSTIHQMDVKTAFLNGQLEEEIYMRLPNDEMGNSQLVRLQKSLYGLKQASRSWNQRFDEVVKKLGFIPLKSDCCVYQSRARELTLVLYVDDILIVPGRKSLIRN